MIDFEQLKQIGHTAARDLETWNELYKKSLDPRATRTQEQKISDSLELLHFGSFYLTTLTQLRWKLHNMDTGTVGTGRASRTALFQEIDNTISVVRSALSATSERNKTLRELFTRHLDRQREMVSPSG